MENRNTYLITYCVQNLKVHQSRKEGVENRRPKERTKGKNVKKIIYE